LTRPLKRAGTTLPPPGATPSNAQGLPPDEDGARELSSNGEPLRLVPGRIVRGVELVNTGFDLVVEWRLDVESSVLRIALKEKI
jgi:hypothetical protein